MSFQKAPLKEPIVSKEQATSRPWWSWFQLVSTRLGELGTDQSVTFSSLNLTDVKSGTDQADAGAAAGEVWVTASHATLPDNVLMLGV